MKAIEAAKHSDVIRREIDADLPYYKAGNGKWYCDGGEVLLNEFTCDDYVPLVPKEIYKVGDQVTFLEALNSRMCLAIDTVVYRWKDQSFWQYIPESRKWHAVDSTSIGFLGKQVFTLCEDPSIPPKPTLESLPAWTRCKVKPVNYTVGICDVIKKPGGSFEYYDSGNGFGFVNVKLISFYNPKTEQWEDV